MAKRVCSRNGLGIRGREQCDVRDAKRHFDFGRVLHCAVEVGLAEAEAVTARFKIRHGEAVGADVRRRPGTFDETDLAPDVRCARGGPVLDLEAGIVRLACRSPEEHGSVAVGLRLEPDEFDGQLDELRKKGAVGEGLCAVAAGQPVSRVADSDPELCPRKPLRRPVVDGLVHFAKGNGRLPRSRGRAAGPRCWNWWRRLASRSPRRSGRRESAQRPRRRP